MDYFLAIFTSFILSFLAIYIAHPIAIKAGLVDIPNSRKQHEGAIPLIGGISIFFGVFVSSLLFIENDSVFNTYILSSALIVVLGAIDDKYDLAVSIRVIVQVLVSSLVVFFADVYIKSFGFILGGSELELGSLGRFITIIAIVAAINAFNMIDGIDGLAGMLSLVAFMGLTLLISFKGVNWVLLPVIYISAISAFLMYNLRWPSKRLNKIFMGDAGSMLIGFTIIWLLILGVEETNLTLKPVTALYLIAVPLMDMVAIMYRRLKKGTSPFKPDREHLHHIFERAGYTRKQALVFISLFAFLISFLGCVMQMLNAPESVMFLVFLVLFILYNYTLLHIWKVLSWLRKK